MLVSGSANLQDVEIGNAALVALATDLMTHYPEYTDRLGLDIERVQRMILGEAHKIYNTGLVPIASISKAVPDRRVSRA